ncbi:MAG: type II secretion system F family protein, partial [Selenomonadaceae bacterium]|nr:type II secretion system F family protein [Selenomonadaceae bacterium]
QRSLSNAKVSVEHGDNLEKVLRRTIKKISPLYLGLIATGEVTGEIVEMLRQCEAMADFEIDETLRGLPAKAELYDTLLAGAIVAALVFSIMLPIFNMSALSF